MLPVDLPTGPVTPRAPIMPFCPGGPTAPSAPCGQHQRVVQWVHLLSEGQLSLSLAPSVLLALILREAMEQLFS